jgi:hypothetical protein
LYPRYLNALYSALKSVQKLYDNSDEHADAEVERDQFHIML